MAIGSGVELDTGGVPFEKEAALSFPIPPTAPADADFAFVRKFQENGAILYETIDSGSIQDGKLVTDSFPFSGGLIPGIYMTLWSPPLPATGKSPLGVITGIAQETDAKPVEPEVRPLAGVMVHADKSLGFEDGDYTATTGKDGRFVLFDAAFGSTGGTVPLVATDSKGREVRATGFEEPGIFAEFVNLGRLQQGGRHRLQLPALTTTASASDCGGAAL